MTRKTSQEKPANYRPSPAQYRALQAQLTEQKALLNMKTHTITSLNEQVDISKRQGEAAMEQLIEAQQQNATQRTRIETLQKNLEHQSDTLSTMVKEINKQNGDFAQMAIDNSKLREQNSALITAVKTSALSASAIAESLPD